MRRAGHPSGRAWRSPTQPDYDPQTSRTDGHDSRGSLVSECVSRDCLRSNRRCVRRKYLPIGKNATGVIYFEQRNAWGAAQPRAINGKALVKMVLIDSFGKKHTEKFWLPVVTLEEARKYNPSIGTTHDEI